MKKHNKVSIKFNLVFEINEHDTNLFGNEHYFMNICIRQCKK